jgi:hypothetical protein
VELRKRGALSKEFLGRTSVSCQVNGRKRLLSSVRTQALYPAGQDMTRLKPAREEVMEEKQCKTKNDGEACKKLKEFNEIASGSHIVYSE